MANIISGYSEDDIRSFTTRRPQRLLDDYHDSIFGDEGVASRYSAEFLERGRRTVDRIRENRAFRATQASFRKLQNRGRTDAIQKLLSIGELQHAPSRMQRYIMAEPTIRKRWQNNQAAGYEDGYNLKPDQRNAIGHSHSAYRVVMDTVVTKDDKGVVANSYALTKEERNSLSPIEKAEIRATWSKVKQSIWDNMDDPTSQYNARL